MERRQQQVAERGAIVAGFAGLALAGLLMGAASTGPPTEALAAAGPIAKDQIQRFSALVREIQPGEQLRLDPYVMGVAAGQGAPPIFLHAPYSLQALAELLRPDLAIAVLVPGQPGPQGAAAVIELIHGAPPENALHH